MQVPAHPERTYLILQNLALSANLLSLCCGAIIFRNRLSTVSQTFVWDVVPPHPRIPEVIDVVHLWIKKKSCNVRLHHGILVIPYHQVFWRCSAYTCIDPCWVLWSSRYQVHHRNCHTCRTLHCQYQDWYSLEQKMFYPIAQAHQSLCQHSAGKLW